MKKMIIAATMVCVATCMQAASFTWSTAGGIGAIAASDIAAGLSGGKIYSADSGWTIDDAMWTLTYTLTLIYDGKTDVLTGTVTTDGFSGAVYDDTMSSDLVAGGRDIQYTLFYETEIKDGLNKTWSLTSNTMTGTWHAEDMGDITFGYGEPTKWQAVPEPTSGLLMLVGLAGLALRRRQA